MVISKILRLCLEIVFIFYFQKLVFGNIKRKTILFLFFKFPLDIFFQPLFLILIFLYYYSISSECTLKKSERGKIIIIIILSPLCLG